MAEYDLTPTIAGYLDRHLVFPLLEFLDVHHEVQIFHKFTPLSRTHPFITRMTC